MFGTTGTVFIGSEGGHYIKLDGTLTVICNDCPARGKCQMVIKDDGQVGGVLVSRGLSGLTNCVTVHRHPNNKEQY